MQPPSVGGNFDGSVSTFSLLATRSPRLSCCRRRCRRTVCLRAPAAQLGIRGLQREHAPGAPRDTDTQGARHQLVRRGCSSHPYSPPPAAGVAGDGVAGAADGPGRPRDCARRGEGGGGAAGGARAGRRVAERRGRGGRPAGRQPVRARARPLRPRGALRLLPQCRLGPPLTPTCSLPTPPPPPTHQGRLRHQPDRRRALLPAVPRAGRRDVPRDVPRHVARGGPGPAGAAVRDGRVHRAPRDVREGEADRQAERGGRGRGRQEPRFSACSRRREWAGPVR